jgi:hypothetical protein
MSFLKWWENNQPEPEALQLDLFGNSQDITPHEVVDVRTSTKDLNEALKKKGGDEECFRKTAIAITEETFGCQPKELYQATGAKENDRTSLPKDAQKALISVQTVVTHAIDTHAVQSNTQPEINSELTGKSREVAQDHRKFFPW